MAEKKTEQQPRDPKKWKKREAHFKAAHENSIKLLSDASPRRGGTKARRPPKKILLGLRSMLDSAIEHVEPTTK